jgi:hypothetical protein
LHPTELISLRLYSLKTPTLEDNKIANIAWARLRKYDESSPESTSELELPGYSPNCAPGERMQLSLQPGNSGGSLDGAPNVIFALN